MKLQGWPNVRAVAKLSSQHRQAPGCPFHQMIAKGRYIGSNSVHSTFTRIEIHIADTRESGKKVAHSGNFLPHQHRATPELHGAVMCVLVEMPPCSAVFVTLHNKASARSGACPACRQGGESAQVHPAGCGARHLRLVALCPSQYGLRGPRIHVRASGFLHSLDGSGGARRFPAAGQDGSSR